MNNTEDYDNGKKVVPSYLLESQIVVKDNINDVLVDERLLDRRGDRRLARRHRQSTPAGAGEQ